MSDLYAKMIKDGNGNVVPQYYNPSDKKFHALSGQDGKLDVNATVNVSVAPDTFGAAPVVGRKTVTSVAAEIYAGGTVKANRTRMEITNMGDIDIYIGPSGVTSETGLPIPPNERREIKFSSDTAVAIYAISPGKGVVCRVLEV